MTITVSTDELILPCHCSVVMILTTRVKNIQLTVTNLIQPNKFLIDNESKINYLLTLLVPLRGQCVGLHSVLF